MDYWLRATVLSVLLSAFFIHEGYSQVVSNPLSNNDKFNQFFKELYSPQLEMKRKDIVSVVIRKGKERDGVYQNLIRFWFSDKSYINFYNKVYPSKEAALNALPINIDGSYGSARLSWDNIRTEAITIDLKNSTLRNLSISHSSPRILSSNSKNNERFQNGLYKQNKSKFSNLVIARADGSKKVFRLPSPVNTCESIAVTVGGRKVNLGEDYSINPFLQTIEFKNPPKIGKRIRVSYESVQQQFYFNLTFENLTFDESHESLLGADSDRPSGNASYLSLSRTIDFSCTEGESWPEIVESPTNSHNKVLLFRAKKANERSSGQEKVRISANVRGVPAVSFVNSVDVYIPQDWKVLEQYDEQIDWLTLQEYWCATAGEPREGYPQFRMTIGMLKNKGRGEKLYFYLKCQDLFTTVKGKGSLEENYVTLYEVDHRKDRYFPIPIGEWINIKTEVVSGDMNTGHLLMIVTTSNQKKHIVFDETCPTHATGYDLPNANEALYTSLSPLKLYTSSKTLDCFNVNGKQLDLYFDNWSFIGNCITHE